HILVMDDETPVRSLFGQFLESAGYSVALASDGREGLRLMKQQKPDLIITDIMMPEMDGLELLMNIRKQHLDVPVIAISGGMKAQPANFLPQAKKFGAHRVFIKPVELSALLQAVQELLSESAKNK
ncbi:MAG: response regulator, partial [Kiritimatiellales bacterium]